MPKISVIVPIYKVEDYLPCCIDSILAQTFSDFELILVDDGFPDNCGRICDEYAKKDKRIVVIHKENGGVSSARNKGITCAKGDFVAFVDSDDEVTATYLENLLSEDEFDYIFSNLVIRKYEDGSFKDNISSSDDIIYGKDINDIPPSFFYNGYLHSVCGKLFRRKILLENEISFKNYRLSEDSLFNLDYLDVVDNWLFSGKSDYIYYRRNTGANATGKFYPEDINVYVELYKKMINMGIDKATVKNTLFPQFYALCSRCFCQKDKDSKQKKSEINYILKNRNVKKTLAFTKRNKFEMLNAWLFVLKQYKLYSFINKCVRKEF